MKIFITSILVIISIVVIGQKDSTCPAGQTYIWGLRSSGMIVEDGCYPDSLAKIIERDFYKELCEGESGFGSFSLKRGGGGFSHTVVPKWVNDSIGCVITETFSKSIKKNKKEIWVEISEKEYDQLCKCRSVWSDSTKTFKPRWQ